MFLGHFSALLHLTASKPKFVRTQAPEIITVSYPCWLLSTGLIEVYRVVCRIMAALPSTGRCTYHHHIVLYVLLGSLLVVFVRFISLQVGSNLPLALLHVFRPPLSLSVCLLVFSTLPKPPLSLSLSLYSSVLYQSPSFSLTLSPLLAKKTKARGLTFRCNVNAVCCVFASFLCCFDIFSSQQIKSLNIVCRLNYFVIAAWSIYKVHR